MLDKAKMLWSSDRNFNEDDLNNQRFYLVAEHNDLITKARFDLSARELKIMDYVISKIKPDDERFNIIQTSMYELSNVLGLKKSGTSYSQLANNIESMGAKRLRIYNEQERSVTMTGWFERAKIWENGKVELKINRDFAPYLLQLKRNYTQYYLDDTVRLKSKYSIILYKLLREADKDHGSSIAVVQSSPEDLKELLGAPASYTYPRLRDNVLKPAIEEINAKIDDMEVELFTAKRGRSVVQVELHNNFIRNPKYV